METINTEYKEKVTLIENSKPVLKEIPHKLSTIKTVPKLGLMMVGLGGNNGTTVTTGILANKKKLKFLTKRGEIESSYYGSFTQCATTKVGIKVTDGHLEDVYLPIKDILPMVNPNDILISGWDISKLNLFEATLRAKVIEPDLIFKLKDELSSIHPLPAAFNHSFIAANQKDRVDNIIGGSNSDQIAKLREHIKEMKGKVDKVVVLWTANTEMYSEQIDTIEGLEKKIKDNSELPSSVLYAYASIMEHVIFLNGSPQNTLHPAIVQLAEREKTFLSGNDFKTGQTRFKTMMGDFLISNGLRLASVVSYNHLGNNDGKNLSEDKCFRSKEISKSSCLDDMIFANKMMYPDPHSHPIDHTVVIKYIPFVGDSKRALDEYNSQIFLGGVNTIESYNICEDSLLAAPIMIDIVLTAELLTRISVDGKTLGPILSYLSFYFKAPITNKKGYVINNLTRQRQMLVNFMKACAGYGTEDETLMSFNY